MGAFFGDFDEMMEAEFPGFFQRQGIGAAEGVTVVLDEPEVVFLAELQDSDEFERIAKGVGHHDGLGFSRLIGGFKQRTIGIPGGCPGVDEDGNGANLNDRSDRGGETGRHGDDFVAGTDALVRGEFVGR